MAGRLRNEHLAVGGPILPEGGRIWQSKSSSFPCQPTPLRKRPGPLERLGFSAPDCCPETQRTARGPPTGSTNAIFRAIHPSLLMLGFTLASAISILFLPLMLPQFQSLFSIARITSQVRRRASSSSVGGFPTMFFSAWIHLHRPPSRRCTWLYFVSSLRTSSQKYGSLMTSREETHPALKLPHKGMAHSSLQALSLFTDLGLCDYAFRLQEAFKASLREMERAAITTHVQLRLLRTAMFMTESVVFTHVKNPEPTHHSLSMRVANES